MTRRVLNMFLAEVTRCLRLRQTWAGVAAVAVAVGLMLARGGVARDGRADYDFIARAMSAGIGLAAFIMLLAWSACLVAPELGSGSIRLSLTRPVRRGEYVLGKFLAAAAYTALLALETSVLAWTAAAALGEITGVEFGGELLFTKEDMALAWLGGAALALLPLTAGAALGLFVSCCTRSTGLAVSATFGIWILLDLVKHFLGVDRLIFTTYLESCWQVFANRADGLDAEWLPMVGQCAAASLGATALLLAGAVVVMRRRDISG